MKILNVLALFCVAAAASTSPDANAEWEEETRNLGETHRSLTNKGYMPSGGSGSGGYGGSYSHGGGYGGGSHGGGYSSHGGGYGGSHGGGYSSHGGGYSSHGGGYSSHGGGYSSHGGGYSSHGGGYGGGSHGGGYSSHGGGYSGQVVYRSQRPAPVYYTTYRQAVRAPVIGCSGGKMGGCGGKMGGGYGYGFRSSGYRRSYGCGGKMGCGKMGYRR